MDEAVGEAQAMLPGFDGDAESDQVCDNGGVLHMSLRFYLGTHMPHWLGLLDVPLFISRTRLADRRTLSRALGAWALDSGGFTELQYHVEWTIDAAEYARFVRRCHTEIGQLDWQRRWIGCASES